jgi:hypothetical protein
MIRVWWQTFIGWTDRRLANFRGTALERVSSSQDLYFCSGPSFVEASVDMRFCHNDSKLMYIGAIYSKPDA